MVFLLHSTLLHFSSGRGLALVFAAGYSLPVSAWLLCFRRSGDRYGDAVRRAYYLAWNHHGGQRGNPGAPGPSGPISNQPQMGLELDAWERLWRLQWERPIQFRMGGSILSGRGRQSRFPAIHRFRNGPRAGI